MADSENVPEEANAPATVDFETLREAINLNVANFKQYLIFGKPLKLSEAERALEAQFHDVVAGHLAGISADERLHRDISDALSFAHDICPNPWRAAFITWVRDSEAFKELLASAKAAPEHFTYHGFIGDMCEAFGQALAAPGAHPVISPYYDANAPDAVHYKTRLADGTWKDVTQDELLSLARDPSGPQIVFCANHAFLDNQKFDLDGLQNEFSKLFDGSRLPITRNEDSADTGHLSTEDKAALGKQDTITVFATHTRENRFLNLAQLFKRLDEVDHHQSNPESDIFVHAAPIAAATVETLLKSIVEDADIDKVHFGRDATGKPQFFDSPITLRPDAVEVLRRQRYRGFSKGGNDFRDAMRLLVHTLDAKDVDGNEKVHLPAGVGRKDVLSNISMIVFGLNEKPMADYYRAHGVRVPIVSSKNDTTAPVPPFDYDACEPVYNYTGKAKRDANGTLVDDGHSPQYSVEGMLADWRIHDLLRMHGAVSQGQAAITDINLLPGDDGNGYHPNALGLEVAHGTSDAMMDVVVGPLNHALRQAGLGDTTLKRDEAKGQGRDRYYLINNDPAQTLVTPENIEKLQTVLRGLSATHKPETRAAGGHAGHPAMPLWVSEATAYEKISGIARFLTLEQQGKLDQETPYPVSVIDPASVTQRARFTNAQGVREHPRTERNLSHPRVAPVPNGEQQLG